LDILIFDYESINIETNRYIKILRVNEIIMKEYADLFF